MKNLDQFFQIAKKFHQNGDLTKAELFYRKILAVEPDSHQVKTSLSLLGSQYHSLSLIAFKEQQLEKAIDLLEKAIVLQPDNFQFYTNLGNLYKAEGNFKAARETYNRALELNPNSASNYNNLGLIAYQQGQLEEAVDYYLKALSIETLAETLMNLGNTYQKLDKFDLAVEVYQQAIQLNPDFYSAHFNLANLYKKQHTYELAIRHYQLALKLNPHLPEAHNNLAMTYQELDNLSLALDHIEQALALNPHSVSILNNMGSIVQKMGRVADAITYYQQALTLEPTSAESHYHLGNAYYQEKQFEQAIEHYQITLNLNTNVADAAMNLGNIYLEQDNLEKAISCYEQAIKEREEFFAAYNNLGDVLQETGNLEAAIEQYKRAYSIEPNDSQLFRLALILPPIYRSVEELAWWRQRLTQCLADLKTRALTINDPLTEVGRSNFYLSYQGLNDRDIQTDIAQLYLSACPDLLYLAPHCQNPRPTKHKIKIGFISCNLKKHSIGKFIAGSIAHLSSELFEVFLFRFEPSGDEIAQWLDTQVDHVIVVSDKLKQAREEIASYELDILFYPDIGMDAIIYFLAFARLAPLQCVTWGHGVTTGIPTLDYFISCRDMETENAQDYYSEPLALMENLLPYYYRPALPSSYKTRADFGLPEDRNLYICPQSLFKIHPEFDEVLGQILEQDPQGELLLLEGTHSYWLSILKQRFRQTIPNVLDRIRFLPRLSRHDFTNLVAICEVMLDPFPIVGGNSTYDSLVTGIPIVTLPTVFSRGRVTSACYQKMGMIDCIAQNKVDYVQIAVKLGRDKLYRKEISHKISALCQALYEDMSAVRELEQLLIRLYQERVKVIKEI